MTDNKIIIEGVEYTPEELDEIYKELLTPTPATPSQPRFSLGNGLQFIFDEKLYQEIVKYMDKTFPAHKENLSGKLSFDGVMKGSSPYIATAVDMFLKSANSQYRIATQRDLETNLQMFKDYYEDTGLALRSVGNPNKDRAKHLYEQIKKANPSIKFPIFLDLRGLELDANLNFNLTSESKYKTAECLNWKSGTKFSKTDEFGLPKEKDENSSRQIWTLKDGLVRLYLYSNLVLNSNSEYLAYSYDFGRVALVSAGGGAS